MSIFKYQISKLILSLLLKPCLCVGCEVSSLVRAVAARCVQRVNLHPRVSSNRGAFHPNLLDEELSYLKGKKRSFLVQKKRKTFFILEVRNHHHIFEKCVQPYCQFLCTTLIFSCDSDIMCIFQDPGPLVNVGAVGAAATTDFLMDWFCTHRFWERMTFIPSQWARNGFEFFEE